MKLGRCRVRKKGRGDLEVRPFPDKKRPGSNQTFTKRSTLFLGVYFERTVKTLNPIVAGRFFFMIHIKIQIVIGGRIPGGVKIGLNLTGTDIPFFNGILVA